MSTNFEQYRKQTSSHDVDAHLARTVENRMEDLIYKVFEISELMGLDPEYQNLSKGLKGVYGKRLFRIHESLGLHCVFSGKPNCLYCLANQLIK